MRSRPVVPFVVNHAVPRASESLMLPSQLTAVVPTNSDPRGEGDATVAAVLL